MNTIEQTLSAGVPVTFPGAHQFHLLEADEPVDVTFYDNRNKPLETWAGMKGGFRIAFEKGFIQVRLESATGQTVKIALTSGRGEYDRSQGDVTADVTKATMYEDAPDKEVNPGVLSTILTARDDHRAVYITNLVGNPATLRIGYTATADRGTQLAPGETIVIETSRTIACWNPGTVSQKVAISYTSD